MWFKIYLFFWRRGAHRNHHWVADGLDKEFICFDHNPVVVKVL